MIGSASVVWYFSPESKKKKIQLMCNEIGPIGRQSSNQTKQSQSIRARCVAFKEASLNWLLNWSTRLGVCSNWCTFRIKWNSTNSTLISPRRLKSAKCYPTADGWSWPSPDPLGLCADWRHYGSVRSIIRTQYRWLVPVWIVIRRWIHAGPVAVGAFPVGVVAYHSSRRWD